MSENQNQPRRISTRRNQGVPPAHLEKYVTDMPIQRSPLKETPEASHPSEHAVSTPIAEIVNPPAQPVLPAKTPASNSPITIKPSAQPLSSSKTQVSSAPATTSKAANEIVDFRRQIDQLQKQMQAMQAEFITSNSNFQAQLLSTTQNLMAHFANPQSTLQGQQPSSFFQQPTSLMPQPTPLMPQPTPTPSQPIPTPSLPQPTPLMPQPTPTPSQPIPTPSLPQPTPLMPQPTPLMPQPTPLMPQPTPTPSQPIPTPSLLQPPPSLNPQFFNAQVTSRAAETSEQTPYTNSFSIPNKKIYPLPIFTGLPEEWQTFSEAFQSTTMEFGYSSLHNIMRMRESLKGRAYETVESLLSSSANVNAIMEILQETFGRPEQLVRSQIEKVRAIPPLVSDNLEALVNFANKISNMATFLKNVRGEHHLCNPSLLSELVSKLPTNRQMQWAEKSMSLHHQATIVDFSDWLAILRRLANIVNDSLPPAPSRRQPASTAQNSRKYACVGIAVSSICVICQGECTGIKKCSKFLQMNVNDRWSQIKQAKACFCCLQRGHQSRNCNTKRKCGINDCQKPHHRLLHNPIAPTSTMGPPPPRQSNTALMEQRNVNRNMPDSQPAPSERRNCHAATRTDNVLFQILPVTLYGKHKQISTYAFVDDGANVSMLDSDIARELDIRGEPETLELQWMTEHTIKRKTEKINLTLSGNDTKNKQFTIYNVYLSADLSLPIQSCHISKFWSSSDCDKIPKMQDYANVQPKLILSLTHSFLTVPLEVPRMLNDSGPIVAITRLGPIVYGPIPGEKSAIKKRALHVRRCLDEDDDLLRELHEMMRGYFDVETLGIKVNTKKLMSKDDERAMELLKQNIRKIDDRYECSLLWRENMPPIPDSYQMALNRLHSVERKMSKDSEYASQYCEKIQDYLKKGYARKLSQVEKERQCDRVFYLPHFGVKNANKKGIRIVFDAAAEIDKFSLNKALLPGPDINKSLISILFKFREAPIAVCGDIQEMFHQIYIAKEDQNSQRFLWRNGDTNQPVETFLMERMIFGATCSPTIAQFVKNYNANIFIKESPRAVHGIVERHYVDDYVDCFESEEEAIRVVQDVIRIHKAGGFNLRNIISNSINVKNACGNSGADDNCGDFLIPDDIERVLGIHWSAKTDAFCFLLKMHKVDKEILKGNTIPTKREMLSVNMSIYDPFGFICDFMVTSKVLMQRVWKANVRWDEQLPPEIYDRWKGWLDELPKLLSFSVPRCYYHNFMSSRVELHVFVDASEEAMAAVAYFRVVSDENIEISFVMAKTSCAPTRYHTTPKLELQAAVMGVRMKNIIVKNHLKNVSAIYFWTDSFTVVQWIRSDHRVYKQYVANRVSEILEDSAVDEWRWCPGYENPADEATRAKFSKDYMADGRWKNGPTFLRLDHSQWPEESLIGNKVDSCDSELRSKHRVLLTRQVCAGVPKFNRFSKYCRLKRAMAWVWRYHQNLLSKIRGEATVHGELTVDEETNAEIFLCRHVQQQVFADEFADLQQQGMVAVNSPIKMLNPFIGADKLLRVSGRIENAAFLSIETRQPIILPKTHLFTRLLVESYHNKFCHINTATAMSEIRLRFWVPSLRQLLNSIQSRCQKCRIRRSKPRQPQMSALPVERVTPYVRAFTYTGLDYFGPVTVSIRRKREKRWVALFTCLSVRAVHLEIATDLSTDACLLCIRNFINRRGVPVQIRSDNGTNFVGIAKELNGASTFLDNNSLTSGVTALGIKWVYNTPANPSEGGVWERLVQSVKKALYIMLKEQAPRLDTLQSFLIEVENMVNSRPLTHLPVTPEDPEPLTPNHFLLGCTNSTQTPAPYEPRLMCLRKQWRVVQNLKNGMWHQWIRDYLPELTRRTKWCLPSQPMAVGCLVFICDVDVPRSQWKRGRVIGLHPGKDGVARSAEVRTNTGVYRRPVSKLAILDVSCDDGESSPTGSVHGGGDVDDGHLTVACANVNEGETAKLD